MPIAFEGQTRGDPVRVASAPQSTPQVRLIGFRDGDFLDKLINDLRNLGFDGRTAYLDVDPAVEKHPVVIDISEAHPLFGGSTGWQLVRHFLSQGARVVVVANPGCVIPEDIAGRAGVFMGNPGTRKLASAVRSET
jgi:hypothetical protein